MKITADALTTATVYRLKKRFAVVHFDAETKGRIVFLPQGTELRVVGPSRLSECLEVLSENQRYNIFKVDLLGPWAVPIGEPRPIERRRVAMAAEACA
jgi:hypothetical protein